MTADGFRERRSARDAAIRMDPIYDMVWSKLGTILDAKRHLLPSKKTRRVVEAFILMLPESPNFMSDEWCKNRECLRSFMKGTLEGRELTAAYEFYLDPITPEEMEP